MLPPTRGGRYSATTDIVTGPPGRECADNNDCLNVADVCHYCIEGCNRCVCETEWVYQNTCRYLAATVGTGLWLLGFSEPVTEGPTAIGNVFRNIGANGSYHCISVSASSGLRLTHNVCESDGGEPLPFKGVTLNAADGHTQRNGVIAHNRFNPTNSLGAPYHEAGVYSTVTGQRSAEAHCALA